MQGIYKITNNLNGKVYIGQSKNIERRFKQHVNDSKRPGDRRGKSPLYDDMRVVGVENFSVELIESCEIDSMDDREKFWINHFLSKGMDACYNRTAESRAFRDERVIKEIHSPEIMAMHGARIKEYNLKMWQDPEYRAKKAKASSELQKKRLQDPEYFAKKKADLAKATDKKKRKVEQYDLQGNLLAEYNGVREASRASGVGSAVISGVALGKRKTAGGFVWKYPQ